MAPETRSQDVRKMEESLEAANQRIDGVETSLHAQSDDLAQLKAMMKEMATQQIVIKQTLQALAGEASSSQDILTPQHVPTPTIQTGQGKVHYLPIDHADPGETSQPLKEKRCTNGCTNATNILTWKRYLKMTS